MKPVSAISYLTGLIVATVALGDRVTKMAIQRGVTTYDSIPVIPEWLRIVHTENPGAAFGFLAQAAPMVRNAVLIGISSLVLVFVGMSLWGRDKEQHSLLMRVGLALVFAGAAGNLYDRVVHQTVTDFIEVYHGAWSFPAFNVADSAISVGAALLVLSIFAPRSKHVTGAAHVSQTH